MRIKVSVFCSVLGWAVLSIGCSKNNSGDGTPVDSGSEVDVSGAENESPNSSSDSTDNSAVFGTWVSECEIDDSIDYYEWTFSPDQVIVDAFEYAQEDIECSSPTQRQTVTYSVNYLSDVQQTTLGTATKYDITPVAFTDYDTIDSTVDGIPVAIVDLYGIYLVVNDRLYGGDLDSGEGLSQEDRPTEIDEADFLLKK